MTTNKAVRNQLAEFQPRSLSGEAWANARAAVLSAVEAAEPSNPRQATVLASRLCSLLAWTPMSVWDRSGPVDLDVVLTRDQVSAYTSASGMPSHEASSRASYRVALTRVLEARAGLRSVRHERDVAAPAAARSFWPQVVGRGPFPVLVRAYRCSGGSLHATAWSGLVPELVGSWNLACLARPRGGEDRGVSQASGTVRAVQAAAAMLRDATNVSTEVITAPAQNKTSGRRPPAQPGVRRPSAAAARRAAKEAAAGRTTTEPGLAALDSAPADVTAPGLPADLAAMTNVSIRELAEGYADNQEAGVVGYGGNLDIRPPYQREFVYKDKQRDAVVDTVFKTYPLNVMYWAVRLDGGFEIIDGQQRTISVCQYVNNDFSFDGRYFNNLQADEQEKFLDYQLTVYRCSGTDSEKLAWFRTINIAGEKLTEQELRNAVYSGSWVSAAKPIFSKSNCPAYLLGNDYLTGSPIRQDYLETVISWLNDEDVEGYMAAHQHDPNANAEWLYFQSVIAWVRATFPNYRSEMKGVQWGFLYNKHKDDKLDPAKLEAEVARLMEDEDVSNKKGTYSYLLNGEERHLSIRAFSKNQKREAYERQKGVCVKCKKTFELEEMEADHITPWSKGGRTDAANCQLLCLDDNRRKGGK